MRVVDYRVHPKPVVKFLLISVTFWVIFRLKSEDCGLGEAVRYKTRNRRREALRLRRNSDARKGIGVIAPRYLAMNHFRHSLKIPTYISITVDATLLDVFDTFVPRWKRLSRRSWTRILRTLATGIRKKQWVILDVCE